MACPVCAAQEKADALLAEKDRELAEKDRELAEKDRELAEKDRELAAKDEQITMLKGTIDNMTFRYQSRPFLDW